MLFRSIVRALRSAGVEASDITVLAACAPGEFPPEPTAEEGLAANQTASWLLSGLKAAERERIQAVWHQPAAEGDLVPLLAERGHRPRYQVSATNTAAYRPVKLGGAQGTKRIVREGLSAGEKIIVNGMARVRPGMPVAPQDAPPPTAQSAAGQH